MTKLKKAIHQAACVVAPILMCFSLLSTCYADSRALQNPLFKQFWVLQKDYSNAAGAESMATQNIVNTLNNIVKNMKDLPAFDTSSVATTLESIKEGVQNIANNMPEKPVIPTRLTPTTRENNVPTTNESVTNKTLTTNQHQADTLSAYLYEKNGNVQPVSSHYAYNSP
jgi:hypothetical protein